MKKLLVCMVVLMGIGAFGAQESSATDYNAHCSTSSCSGYGDSPACAYLTCSKDNLTGNEPACISRSDLERSSNQNSQCKYPNDGNDSDCVAEIALVACTPSEAAAQDIAVADCVRGYQVCGGGGGTKECFGDTSLDGTGSGPTGPDKTHVNYLRLKCKRYQNWPNVITEVLTCRE